MHERSLIAVVGPGVLDIAYETQATSKPNSEGSPVHRAIRRAQEYLGAAAGVAAAVADYQQLIPYEARGAVSRRMVRWIAPNYPVPDQAKLRELAPEGLHIEFVGNPHNRWHNFDDLPQRKRYYGDRRQLLCRFDTDNGWTASDKQRDTARQQVNAAAARREHLCGLLIADYGWPYYTLDHTWEEQALPVVVSTRRVSWISTYVQFLPAHTVYVCNEQEFESFVTMRERQFGIADLRLPAQVADVAAKFKVVLIVTRGANKIVVADGRAGNSDAIEVPVPYVDQADALGAGDAFVAALLSELVAGVHSPVAINDKSRDWEPAVLAAGAAASAYVREGLRRFPKQPRPFVPPVRLRGELLPPGKTITSDVATVAWLSGNATVRALRHRVSGFVLTNGCFDLLHKGHEQVLLRACQRAVATTEGDKPVSLVVAVNDDESVKALKGHGRPARSLEERIHDVRQFLSLNERSQIPHTVHVVAFDGDVPALIDTLTPCFNKLITIVKGAEYDATTVVGAERAELPPVLVSMLPGCSTTSRLAEGVAHGKP